MMMVPPSPSSPPPMPAPLPLLVAFTVPPLMMMVPPPPSFPPPMPAPSPPPVAFTVPPLMVMVPPLPSFPPPMPAPSPPPDAVMLPGPLMVNAAPFCTCKPAFRLPLFSVLSPWSVRLQMAVPATSKAQVPERVPSIFSNWMLTLSSVTLAVTPVAITILSVVVVPEMV